MRYEKDDDVQGNFERHTVPNTTTFKDSGKPDPGGLNKLFVYGIFLGEDRRRAYGMSNPQYATVRDYLTVGGYIVQAKHVPDLGLALTGLVVDIDPAKWDATDSLEAAYDRVKIKTTSGNEAWMYVAKKRRNGSV